MGTHHAIGPPDPAVANPVPDARALYRDFLIHEEGRGVSRNPETAADRLLAAYKAGDSQAKAMLFRFYRRLRMETRRAIQRRLTAAGHDPGVANSWAPDTAGVGGLRGVSGVERTKRAPIETSRPYARGYATSRTRIA